MNNTILIVDDEADIREICCYLFTKQGWNVIEAEDGFSALEQINQHKPEIILTDVNMPMKSNGKPGLGGFDLITEIRKLKESSSYEPFIFVMSGYLKNTDHVSQFPEVESYFDKPLSVKDMESKIKQTTQRKVA